MEIGLKLRVIWYPDHIYPHSTPPCLVNKRTQKWNWDCEVIKAVLLVRPTLCTERQLRTRHLSSSPSLSPPYNLSSETLWVKIIGFTIFKNPVHWNRHIPDSSICCRICWTFKAPKQPCRMNSLPYYFAQLVSDTFKSFSEVSDPWPWHMVWSSGDDGLAWGPVSHNSLQTHRWRHSCFNQGLSTKYTNRTLPGAVRGHHGWFPSTIFYCANADKQHSNGSWGAILPAHLDVTFLFPSLSKCYCSLGNLPCWHCPYEATFLLNERSPSFLCQSSRH